MTYRTVLAATAATIVQISGAAAQDRPATAGGDVTADGATVLPPVVVESPAKPIARSRARIVPATRPSTPAAPPDAFADGSAEPVAITAPIDRSPAPFTLGQLDLIGGSVLTNDAMWTFNTNTLDKAANLVPGVVMQNAGGSRNERDIYVRGFDRFRVPLSIDGVRIYLPADNRLDFGRFLTPDIAEIQVQKGYVSVLNGPGGMGGAINLVSRKPTERYEAEARVGIVTSGDGSTLNSWSTYAYAGSKQDKIYAQISGTIVDTDHFTLSNKFSPTLLENGESRDNSEAKDWKVNAKIGFTPNSTDEYVINYTTQHGKKSAPLHTLGQRVQGPRYWKWPFWDISTVSWLSKTEIAPGTYIKTNAYYNTFDNLLSSFNSATYQNQIRNSQDFNSYYKDHAYGGFIEFGTKLIPMNTLKGVVHYRRDNHAERSDIAPDNPNPAQRVYEPWHGNVEDTWSLAFENTFHATKRVDVVMGMSYDKNKVLKADDFTGGRIVGNVRPTADAFNYQGGIIYSLTDTGKLHATVSNRTRFPTVFERYSTRFGLAVANPDLQPERAINYELGWSERVTRNVKLSGAAFYSTIKDSIQPVFVRASGGSAVQNQNVDGQYYGAEASIDWDIVPGLRVGGNYTWLIRELDYLTPTARPEGTPEHKTFLYLAWSPTSRLTITPSLELATSRYALITSSASTLLLPANPHPNYIKTGNYALLNLQAEYKFNANLSAAIGGTNLLDQNYAFAEGFPEPGRMLFANLKAKF